VGQAKRRHVLRYIAARERAGILGTGPFDLDEALVKLDAWMTAGCRWALAVAVELALTGQRPGCTACAGIGAQASTFEQATGIDGRTYWLGVDFAACSTCRGTGHNTHASLPWPAWLRRKGREAAGDEALRRAAMLGHSIPDWARFAFSATCETFVECTDEARRPVPVAERRAETRTRSFPRGAHRLADPVLAARIVSIPSEPYSYTSRLPAWLRGDMRHADQRRERALASASKAERARQAMRRQGVEDLLRGSLTTARAATASDPAEQTRLAVEAARLYAAGAIGVAAADAIAQVERTRAYSRELSGSWTLDESAAAGYAFQQQRISGNSLGLADRLRVPLDVEVLQRGTALMSVDGATMPVTIADGVMRLDSGQRLTLMPDGSVTASIRSWHRRLQALDERAEPVAVHVAVEQDGSTE
jgi:hypothetical protein